MAARKPGGPEVLISAENPNQVALHSAIPWLGPPAFLSLCWRDSGVPSAWDWFCQNLKAL